MAEYRITIHEPAQVHHTAHLGHGCEVWPYSTLLEGVQVGEDVTIGTCVFIGRYVRIGTGTRLHPGCAIPDHAQIGAYVFVGANVVLMDVRYPNLRAKGAEQHRPPIIQDDVVLGSNACILPGVVVGQGAVIGAGAVVTRDVAPWTVMVGNPAHPLPRRRMPLSCNEAGEVLWGVVPSRE